MSEPDARQTDPDPACFRFSVTYTNIGNAATVGGSVAVNVHWWTGNGYTPAGPGWLNTPIPGQIVPGQTMSKAYRLCVPVAAPAGYYAVASSLGSAIYN
ncbi:hypothetical protein [Frankia sp. QA3]|uniref:hypothetical protein n=1 Tax=Frankia sp. QA3 TaxID=710111 RepID=UPI00030E07B0|nr:hypothetical protein [Frankia sp. QA3]